MRAQGREHRPTIAIVQFEEAHAACATEAPEKATQTGGIRIPGQPRQVLEHAVVSKGLREAQPLHPEDNRIEHGQHGLADLVAVVALPEPHRLRELTTETNPLEELVNKDGSTVVGQRVRVERDTQIFRPAQHCTRTSPKVRFSCNGLFPSQSSDTRLFHVLDLAFTLFSGLPRTTVVADDP
jgi:hypothetical protein